MADLRFSFHDEKCNLSNLPEQNTEDYLDCARSSAPSLMSVAFSEVSADTITSDNSTLSKFRHNPGQSI
jgi:hypothetical protein